ncbi:MAG: transketolase [Candidatus Woesearchaeota archaeon]
MPIVNSKTDKIIKQLNSVELKEAANLMRGYNLISLCAAKSGHSGGTLSIMDLSAAIYLNVAKHDPKNYQWKDRDRIVWSAGHKAPALFVSLGISGYFDVKDVVRLRKLGSPYQGHPDWKKLNGVEVSTGSLGQGLSIACGMALKAKLDRQDFKVFCIMGDGEQQEGQIWEAVMTASHHKLDNLIGIVDKNMLQIDGDVKNIKNVYPLAEKYRAFGWNVIEIDGHDIDQILGAFERAVKNSDKSSDNSNKDNLNNGKPTVIIADTVKGKGVSFMENVAGWHGKAPSKEELVKALKELNLLDKIDYESMLESAEKYHKKVLKELEDEQPKFSRDYWWNSYKDKEGNNFMVADMKPTRKGFGETLEKEGDDERIVCIGLDISGSITIDMFYKNNPERKKRFISVGIAEQDGTCIAAGLAKEGKIPVIGTYGVFASARNADQLRTTVCYGKLNVLVAGAHGGVSVGPDGATHQSLEELYMVGGLPNINLSVPCDSVETAKATKTLLFDIKGPKYIRFAREATPVVTDVNTPFVFGRANVIRFRGEKPRFADAFEHKLASEYQNEDENLSIIACGPMVPEAMRAAWILKKEYKIEARVINLHTIKPLDNETIERAAKETSIIITAEEHQKGGMGNKIAAVILQSMKNKPENYDEKNRSDLVDKNKHCSKNCMMDMIGIDDRFGESGEPWELIKKFKVSGEHIAEKAKRLYDLKKV